MTEHYLAVDIGASSGRVLAGEVQNGKITIQELHRFENRLIQKDKQLCWDIEHLFNEIKQGIHKSKQAGMSPASIGIDTWAVDFVLLDENDELLTDAVAYRDRRTDGMMEEVFQLIGKKELYERTGIQFQKFNTIFQLYSLKKNHPELLKRAKTFLMIPDYLNFLLTGKKANEYTNATTTQLMKADEQNWDQSLLKNLGINVEMFQEIKSPKSILGQLRPELQEEFGFDLEVILPATHDTGSAVAAVPEEEDTIYISSGTWSLIGVENQFPITKQNSYVSNFTNEGGVEGTYRFLKNIMGLWMIQEVRRNYQKKYSFSELVQMAKEASHFTSIVNVNDDRYLLPHHMIEEIRNECRETKQAIPITPGEVARTVFMSLAESYKQAVEEIEAITGRRFSKINVIGGGSQNEYLNQLIANVTQKEVYAGPIEATAIGNLSLQLMALKKVNNLLEARQMIRRSFAIQTYISMEGRDMK
ncbi:rhamnulokinase [Bacillus sp. FJAT-50079]|uniref:rhamnulokinase n=1 Tax=Bacillus sp. FJAT-50079 TaxID=2833577 RepID=UPI001BCA1790|nr:rhamnulokinase [Bacillus sp. FJAT-50079]MBS4207836.1 rhamnulokinase [Bacillus sp. FJAT-50079]